MKKDTVERIKDLIDKMRPFLINDGGDISFIEYKDNVVYVSLSGACKDCALIDYTLKDGIEEMIISEIPEVKAVVNVDNQ
jgi:Fe-S cluster biogenesis protein NfuA